MWRQLWRDSAGCCCGCGYGGRAAAASSGTRDGGDTAGQVLINLVGPLLDLRSCFLKCFSILSINAFAANNFKPRAVVVAQWVERLLLTLESVVRSHSSAHLTFYIDNIFYRQLC